MYLNFEKLNSLSSDEFLNKSPYPWCNPKGALTEEGFKRLHADLPDIERFERSEGKERNFGQKPHDRFVLEYEEGMNLPTSWREFIQEIFSEKYANFIRNFFGFKEDFVIRAHWHYAHSGDSVSPHVDGYRKLGSQIFYFNTHEDWNEEWGGQTLVLCDSNGKHVRESAPEFSQFDEIIKSKTLDNHSFLFKNEENAWHGVSEIKGVPEGSFRHVFIVIFDKKEYPYTRSGRFIKKVKMNFLNLLGKHK